MTDMSTDPRQFAHTIGTNYEATRDLDIAVVAKLVRRDLKDAKQAGTIPADAKVSVRIQRYSLGQSIDVTIALPDRPARVQVDRDFRGQYVYTPEAETALCAARTVLDAYNYDNSDVLTDYFQNRFSGLVTVTGVER